MWLAKVSLNRAALVGTVCVCVCVNVCLCVVGKCVFKQGWAGGLRVCVCVCVCVVCVCCVWVCVSALTLTFKMWVIPMVFRSSDREAES